MPNDFGDLLRASPVERSGKLRRLLVQHDLPRALAVGRSAVVHSSKRWRHSLCSLSVSIAARIYWRSDSRLLSRTSLLVVANASRRAAKPHG